MNDFKFSQSLLRFISTSKMQLVIVALGSETMNDKTMF